MIKALKNREISNASWIISERIIQMLVSLVVSLITARYLGPGNYGALNYTASFVTFFSSVATLGMDAVVIKKLIEYPEHEGSYLGGCLVLRLISSISSGIAIVVLVFILNVDDQTKVVLAFLQSLQFVFQSVNILDCWFQRHLKSKYVSIGKMIACFIVEAYKILLIVTAKTIEWFAFSTSLTSLVVAVVLFIFYRHNHGPRIKADLSMGIATLKESYHYILSGLMVAIYSQMDKIMIGKMMTDLDVGLYSTANAICGMWIFIPMAIIQSFRPAIMEKYKSGSMPEFRLSLERLYSTIIWLCIFVSLVVSLGAPLIVQVLYGKAYLGAAKALRIAIWYETFSMIGTARGIWVVCENKGKYVKYYLAIGALVNVILNALLIPQSGIDGAAVATLVTQIVTSIIAPMLFKQTREHSLIVFEAFTFKWYFANRRRMD